MDENRKKLLELIEKLGFSVDKEELEKEIMEMSEEEVVERVATYSDIVDYEEAMEDFVKEASPADYERIVRKSNYDLQEKDESKLHEEELDREFDDIKLDEKDKMEENSLRNIEEFADESAALLEDLQAYSENYLKNPQKSE